MRKHTEPTCTSKLLAAAQATDDFLTAKQFQKLISCNCNQVSAALHHLRNRQAMNCMEDNGQLWWYATPATDDRQRVIEERVPETKKRKTRQKKVPASAK